MNIEEIIINLTDSEFDKAAENAAYDFHDKEFGRMEQDSIYRVCFIFGARWAYEWCKNQKSIRHDWEKRELRAKLEIAREALEEISQALYSSGRSQAKQALAQIDKD